MRRTVLALAVLALATGLAACGESTVGGDYDAGPGGGRRDAGDGGEIILVPPDAGGPQGDTGWVDPCPPEAKLVYTVDSDNTFSSFDPKALKTSGSPWHDLGTLNCPAGGAAPFSMSVDRSATAWILFDDGALFKVSTASLACTKTAYTPKTGLELFGMGFVSDAPGSLMEKLYIAGSPDPGSGASTLATLDTASLTVKTLGTFSGSPELTGTGDAKLWGFFPDLNPPKVAQLDKTTGKDLTGFSAPGIAGTPRAWAFAFWGGDFFIFLERSTDSSTSVHRMSSKDGTLTTPLPNTGRRIVGAGVSTCAPIDPT